MNDAINTLGLAGAVFLPYLVGLCTIAARLWRALRYGAHWLNLRSQGRITAAAYRRRTDKAAARSSRRNRARRMRTAAQEVVR